MEYLIELDRWGIKQGSFGKPPYTNEQWEIAYNNLLGFNMAFSYAKTSGFRTIVVPRGNYSFCYTNLNGGAEIWEMKNTAMKLFSNQILDLNGSTFEVMYDSVNKNPYDKSPVTTPAWKLSGKLIEIHECENTYIINGKIIGDIPNRNFSDGGPGFNSEKGMEQTYGIYIDYGSAYCGVYQVDVSMFMGDGITLGCYPVKDNWYVSQYDPVALPGYVDSATSTIIQKDGCYVSEKCILKPEHRLLQMRTGWGYTRIPPIKNNYFEYVFFDAADKVIGRKRAVYLQTIQIPANASYLRVQFLEESIGLSQFKITYIIAKPQAHHITISKCNIHNNHRGGISGGSDFTTIKFNRIYHNGMDSGIGVPLFPDTTRYAVNFEDSYSNKLTIEDNHIFSGFNGLLLGVYHAEVIRNYISEFSTAIAVYNNANTNIQSNTIYNAALLGLMSSMAYQERNITVRDNTIYGGVTNINTTTYAKTHVKLLDNKLYVDQFTARGNVEVRGNYFKSYTGSKYKGYTGVHCIVKQFIGNTLEDYNYGTYYRCAVLKYDDKSIIKDNIFNSVSFNFPHETNHMEFNDCDFYNCYLFCFSKDKDKSFAIDFDGCRIVDSLIEVGGVYVNNLIYGGVTTSINFFDCKIELNEGGKYSNIVSVIDNKSMNDLDAGVLPRKYEVNVHSSKIKHNVTSKNAFLVWAYDLIIPKKVNINNSLFNINDINKFIPLQLNHTRSIENSVIIKNADKIGFTDFVKGQYGKLIEYEINITERP